MNDKEFDLNHIWHPYTSLPAANEIFKVVGAEGVRLHLEDGTELIDGMASWWAVIHGYNHPKLQAAMHAQIDKFSHVMFGGLRHKPATELARRLIDITPDKLSRVFFSDSGSVAVEVALKMAVQYQIANASKDKKKFLSLKGAYHGDTIRAMAVCDPVGSMHKHFKGFLAEDIFAPRPEVKFGAEWNPESVKDVRKIIENQQQNIAAFIVEPVVQGAGGMYFYHPQYLKEIRKLCNEYNILLIFDEIATGFGRTGKLFATEHADISPDILCLGKALTGGMLSMAATLTTNKVSGTISTKPPHAFMHGPTFMANPLACSAAIASINLLLSYDWQNRVNAIELALKEGLSQCKKLGKVREVRVLGAIGVVELKNELDLEKVQPEFVKKGVWIRPFRNLVYVMPPFTTKPDEIQKLTDAMFEVIRDL